MRVVTYNLNGIRAASAKGLIEWIDSVNPDVLCFQEIKANAESYDFDIFRKRGYEIFIHPAVKKGYSGVAILCKTKPINVVAGCGYQPYDDEGRVLIADFENISVMSLYVPSGSSGELRQGFKYEWMDFFLHYITNQLILRPNLLVSGDFNIAHQPIDIHNPKSNVKTSGFLPRERDWMNKFFEAGFVDGFRELNKEPHNYTWWSQRFPGVRDRNLGWRIDYHMISRPLVKKLKRCVILPTAKHSDHCPVIIEFDLHNQ
jgi:exodeoxyribonuclease III